jgi:hypothetical protein
LIWSYNCHSVVILCCWFQVLFVLSLDSCLLSLISGCCLLDLGHSIVIRLSYFAAGCWLLVNCSKFNVQCSKFGLLPLLLGSCFLSLVSLRLISHSPILPFTHSPLAPRSFPPAFPCCQFFCNEELQKNRLQQASQSLIQIQILRKYVCFMFHVAGCSFHVSDYWLLGLFIQLSFGCHTLLLVAGCLLTVQSSMFNVQSLVYCHCFLALVSCLLFLFVSSSHSPILPFTHSPLAPRSFPPAFPCCQFFCNEELQKNRLQQASQSLIQIQILRKYVCFMFLLLVSCFYYWLLNCHSVVMAFWLLVACYWLLICNFGCHTLVAGYWLLVTIVWLLYLIWVIQLSFGCHTLLLVASVICLVSCFLSLVSCLLSLCLLSLCLSVSPSPLPFSLSPFLPFSNSPILFLLFVPRPSSTFLVSCFLILVS